MDKKEGNIKDRSIVKIITALAATITVVIAIATYLSGLIIQSKDAKIKLLKEQVDLLKNKLPNTDGKIEPIINPFQEYEWQWTGQNWYGRIKFIKEDGKCKVKMARVFKIKKIYTNYKDWTFEIDKFPVLELKRGKFTLMKPDGLEIQLTVKKKTAGKSDYVEHEIEGKLKRVLCFAGEITFRNTVTERETKGDMVLVHYKSLKGRNIDAKFDPTRKYKM